MKEKKGPRAESWFQKIKNLQEKKSHISTTQIIVFGFFITILIGAILLSLPISSANGTFTPFVDALFTSTTATCVTGLTTVTTATHWSLFGKVVILFLMQFGGLGIVTVTTTLLLLMKRRITLKERMLIQDAYNLDTLRGLVKLTIKILKGTLLVEAVGAVLYAIQFVPEHGFFDGVGRAIFTSVSAFCNAGIDLVGNASLAPYVEVPLINITTMLLIIIGGIGFPVWWDIISVAKENRTEKYSLKMAFRKMELHTKLVLTMTCILIVGGALLIFFMEYNNPQTIGNMTLGDKVMASTFQSVTTRTAGFQTIPQENFSVSSNILFLLFMFIGGSPSGTAGGIKTVTVAVLVLAIWSSIRNKHDVEVFNRRITDSFVRKSLSVFGISFIVLMVSTMLLSVTEPEHGFLDILFETTSAIGTVGLTRGVTGSLSEWGKIIIIVTMYLGRIGPITLALAFNSRKREKCNCRQLPTDKIMVG